MTKMLHIPLRARLASRESTNNLFWKRCTLWYRPQNGFLLDTKVERLPKLPRRLRK